MGLPGRLGSHAGAEAYLLDRGEQHQGLTCWKNAPLARRKGTLSLLHLMSWEIWGERNRRIFQHATPEGSAFRQKIKDEIRMWNMAGAGIPYDPG